MGPNTFRLGLAQITSTDKVEKNLETIEALYGQSIIDRPDLVVFPENSLFLRIESGSAVSGVGVDGPEIARLNKMVEKLGVPMMLTTPVVTGGGKHLNSTLLLRPRFTPEIVYSKIHLFDVDVEGARAVRESDHFVAGNTPRVIEIGGWNFGLSICYDIRFSELYLRYSQVVDVILAPAAFLVPTGEAHWHVLLRARAIEAQCYLAAPAQSGEHIGQSGQVRSTFGHSLIVDPWGKIIEEISDSPKVQVVELTKSSIEKARAQIPMQSHRRL